MNCVSVADDLAMCMQRYAIVWLEEDSWEEIELFLATSLKFPAKSNGSRKKK
jgi:hypothetical protein